MVDKGYPVVPVENPDGAFHRRLIAQRLNAALVPLIDGIADGQTLMWDDGVWRNVGGDGAWTPTLAFGGASTGIAYTTQEGAYYRVGELVFVYGIFTLSNKGSATGTALFGGLPLSVADSLAGTALEGLCNVAYALNMSGLTSAISASILDTGSIQPYEWGATGIGTVTDANFTNTSSVRIHGIYITDAD